MADGNMAQGLSFAEDMKRLEELKKQMEMTQQLDVGTIPDLKAPSMELSQADLAEMASSGAQPQAMDRDALLQDYRDKLMQKIQGSEGRLSEAETAYGESQKAGEGWGGGLRKGAAVFGDMLSGMAGKPGASGTTQLMKGFADERKEGADKYKSAVDKESGYLKELSAMEKKEFDSLIMNDKKQAMDPKSEMSVQARAFVREKMGFDIPDSMNAIQARMFIEKAPTMQLQREKFDYDKEQAKTKAASAEEKKGLEADQYKKKRESELRKELNKDKETQEFIQVKNMYSNVDEAAKNPNAANDLALIFSYMKILDPGSVVREGEFANAQNSAGLPDQIRNQYNKMLRGERLNPAQRERFVSSAKTIYDGRAKNMGGRLDFYRNLAEKEGLDLDNVIYDPTQQVDKASLTKNLPGQMQMSQAPQSMDALSSMEDNKLDELYKALGGK